MVSVVRFQGLDHMRRLQQSVHASARDASTGGERPSNGDKCISFTHVPQDALRDISKGDDMAYRHIRELDLQAQSILTVFPGALHSRLISRFSYCLLYYIKSSGLNTVYDAGQARDCKFEDGGYAVADIYWSHCHEGSYGVCEVADSLPLGDLHSKVERWFARGGEDLLTVVTVRRHDGVFYDFESFTRTGSGARPQFMRRSFVRVEFHRGEESTFWGDDAFRFQLSMEQELEFSYDDLLDILFTQTE